MRTTAEWRHYLADARNIISPTDLRDMLRILFAENVELHRELDKLKAWQELLATHEHASPINLARF